MKKEKSEGILNPYNDKLKKAYLHGGGYIEIDGVEYSPDEYITMLEEANENLIRADKKKSDHIDELEEENKMLHEEQGRLHRLWSKDTKHIAELEEENKKLEEEVKYYKEKSEFLNNVIVNLEEENKKLKEENEYRESIADVLPEGEGHIAEETIQDLQKEIKLLKMSLEEKDENCYGLAKENKELKEELEKLRTDNIYEEGLYD